PGNPEKGATQICPGSGECVRPESQRAAFGLSPLGRDGRPLHSIVFRTGPTIPPGATENRRADRASPFASGRRRAGGDCGRGIPEPVPRPRPAGVGTLRLARFDVFEISWI